MSTYLSWNDVKLGIRVLMKHPALTIVGGVGMAVAVAINVGVFTFMVAYVYPTLPLEEGDRIVALENRDIAQNEDERRSLHDFFVWREQLSSVEYLAAFRTVERNLGTAEGPPVAVEVAEMTAAGFHVARVPPTLGRYLQEDDERPGAPAIVVIAYSIWQNQFASDPAIIGREVLLDGAGHTIVGVMPDGFAFPKNHRFWTPLRARPTDYERRGGPAIFMFGRLAPGVTPEEAQAELSVLGRRAASAFPDTHAQLRPMVERFTHSVADTDILLWEIVQIQLMLTLLLVVVALNVAVLIYARTAARHSEIAVRTALGASRWRVVAQLVAEAFVLASGAAVLGFALAQVGVRAVHGIMDVRWRGAIPFWVDYGIQPTSLALTLALALIATVLTGLLPALPATGRQLQSDLRQHRDTGTRLGRTWTALVIAQIAVAVAALPVAMNLGWNVILDAATRPAYPAEQFVVAELAPDVERATPSGDPSLPERSTAFGSQLSELMRRLDADTAVAGVTFRTTMPDRAGRIRLEGVPAESPSDYVVASVGVHPGFVEVFGAGMLGGRSFHSNDVREDATTVIVNEAFVRQVLRGGEALGRRIRDVSTDERSGSEGTAGRWYEIVGVCEDLLTNPLNPETVKPEVYYPVAPERAERVSLNIRFRGMTPAAFGSRLREIVTNVDPALRLGTVRTLAESHRQGLLFARLAGFIVGLVLVSVLLLSAAGIYAMTSFTVTQRRKEIAIRSALGAHPRHVLWSIFARAAVQIVAGVLAGGAVATLVEQLTGGGLLDGRGGILLPGIALVMAMVALLATVGPARRGLKTQPTEALRTD
ncbi:MAG: ABC transporter permease [Vicinamibacteraceae bacterium]